MRIAVMAPPVTVNAATDTGRPPIVTRAPGTPSTRAGWSSAGSAGQHLRGRGAPAQDRGDRVERDLEHVVEDERHPLRRGEGIHDDVQRQADRVGEQGFGLGIGPSVIRREHPDAGLQRLLAPHPAPAQGVEADPPGHGGEPAAQVLDVRTAGPGQAQPGLLHGIVGIRVRAEHAERDRVQVRAVGLEPGGELLFLGHGSPRRERWCHYQDASRAGKVTPGPALPSAASGRRRP
jgi:hypothetical protein